jgi:hypothetical protein
VVILFSFFWQSTKSYISSPAFFLFQLQNHTKHLPHTW